MTSEIYCNSGHANAATSAFCSSCGTPLGEAASIGYTRPDQETALTNGPTEPVVSWVPPAAPPAGAQVAGGVLHQPTGAPATPPPFRAPAADVPGTPGADDRPRTNRLLIIGALLGLVLPIVVSVVDFVIGLTDGYSSLGPALISGYLRTEPAWYGRHFAVSLVGILTVVACAVVLVAALARTRAAGLLAYIVAPILLIFFIEELIGGLALRWSGGTTTWVTLALELAVTLLILIGAVRSPERVERMASERAARIAAYGGDVSSMAPPASQTGPTDGLAIAALVLSIVGLPACLVGSVVGLVLGYVSRKQISESRGTKGGAGLATASIVIGWVGIGLALGIGYTVLMTSFS